jgi:hypothetical protein
MGKDKAMAMYCIIETEDGWTIAEHPPAGTAEEAAHRLGGTVIDPGPYDSYEDACEALEALQEELDPPMRVMFRAHRLSKGGTKRKIEDSHHA